MVMTESFSKMSENVQLEQTFQISNQFKQLKRLIKNNFGILGKFISTTLDEF